MTEREEFNLKCDKIARMICDEFLDKGYTYATAIGALGSAFSNVIVCAGVFNEEEAAELFAHYLSSTIEHMRKLANTAKEEP